MLEAIAVQLAGRVCRRDDALPEVGELRTVVEHAVRHGFAVGVVRKPGQPRPFWVGVVIRGGGKGKVREVVEKCRRRTEPGRETEVGRQAQRPNALDRGGTEPQARGGWKGTTSPSA